MQKNTPLTWEELNQYKVIENDRVDGPTNSYSNLRLFGSKKENVKLTFYRDRHAWCPYCQKIWLWLEYKRVPYRVKKVNMFCYGKKEKWYLDKLSSGKLPAIELNGKIIAESDDIIYFLEKEFGSLGTSISADNFRNTRFLERKIFRAWCEWLCKPTLIFFESSLRKKNFRESLIEFDNILTKSATGFVDPIHLNSNEVIPGTGDIIFIPYLERINASLCYYKGFSIREEFSSINRWFSLLEKQKTYQGTQSDFHTHAHDLPPQMGGCYTDKNEAQIKFSKLIDNGQGLGNLESNSSCDDNDYFSKFAITRVIRHKENIVKVNPCNNDHFDFALRSVLTYMVNGNINKPNKTCGIGLRYLRDRISVPRDMPLISARLFRQALEKISSLCDSVEEYKIPTSHRYDQDPKDFKI